MNLNNKLEIMQFAWLAVQASTTRTCIAQGTKPFPAESRGGDFIGPNFYRSAKTATAQTKLCTEQMNGTISG